MKVILTKDIKGQGKKGHMVEVSDGYARNYLLPRGLAQEATKSNINVMEGKASSAEFHKQQELDAAKATAEQLKDVTVTIKAKAGANGKLFGSITAMDVAEELKMQHHIKLDKKKFDLKDGIKTLGTKEVTVKIHAGVTGTFKVNVIAAE